VTNTVVDTNLARTITVVPQTGGAKHLTVMDTYRSKEVRSYIYKEDAEKLGLALLGENATVVTDLPEATVEAGYGSRDIVNAGDTAYYSDKNHESVLKHAKELLAIHKHLVEQQALAAKEAEVAKAKEAERTKRRDELVIEHRGWGTYDSSSVIFQSAIDHIIKLEEAAK
jgi:hypothetical protein